MIKSLDSNFAKELYPVLQTRFGLDVAIKNIEVTKGSLKYITHKVDIEYPMDAGKKEETPEVKTLLGSDISYTIDGTLTLAGQEIYDNLAELGKIAAAAFD